MCQRYTENLTHISSMCIAISWVGYVVFRRKYIYIYSLSGWCKKILNVSHMVLSQNTTKLVLLVIFEEEEGKGNLQRKQIFLLRR